MLFLYILFIAAFYFFGAIPFMILIGRIRGLDLTHESDLHHALWYKVGRNWGILGFMLDVFKGILPVLIGFLMALPLWVTILAALASLCGQMWPVFRKFDGERGNTVSLGINATLSIAYGAPVILIVAICFAALGFLVRTTNRWKESGDNLNERLKFGGSPSLALPLGVMLGYVSCPITSWIFAQPQEITCGYAGVIILILIRRVTAGIIQDLHNTKRPLNVIINRLLFDRNEI